MTELEHCCYHNRLAPYPPSERLLWSALCIFSVAYFQSVACHLTIVVLNLSLLWWARIPPRLIAQIYVPAALFSWSSLLISRFSGFESFSNFHSYLAFFEVSGWELRLEPFLRLLAALLAPSLVLFTVPVEQILGLMVRLGVPAFSVQLGLSTVTLIRSSWSCFQETLRCAELRDQHPLGWSSLRSRIELVSMVVRSIQQRLEMRVVHWEQSLELRGGSLGLLPRVDLARPRAVTGMAALFFLCLQSYLVRI